MARIRPFSALKYDVEQVRAADVLTQPYDKITPEMQERYYAASPYNLVRIILGRVEDGDSQPGTNRYLRAAEHFREWQSRGIVVREPRPAMYAYSQRFAVPGEPGRLFERRGFIALGPLHDYEDRVVFRHERTLTGPKQDRLELLRASGAQFELLFMLYQDPARTIEDFAFRDLPAKPDIEMTDEYGVIHRVWGITQPFVLDAISGAMSSKPLVIADGHHRYETALAYARERRGNAGALASHYDFAPMAFFHAQAEELVILPTHRVVFGLPSFSIGGMLHAAADFFTEERLNDEISGSEARSVLAKAGTNGPAFLAVSAEGTYLLRAGIDRATDRLLAALPPAQRELDVVQLHNVLLEHVLGISEEDIREQRHLNYVRDPDEAIRRGRSGANVAFLMNPATVKQVCDIALAGDVMPQKSTDFYPKLLSGLATYDFT